jgi:hypothetical protein
MADNTIPNFDAMSAAALMEFWARFQRPTRKDAEALIGDRRKGFTSLCGTLAAYACAKATAMTCRLEGKIAAALIYEKHCDMYYDSLPGDLKW